MINYKIVSLAASALSVVLFVLLLLVPDVIFWVFGIEGNELARLMSRRAAMLFLGLAIIAYLGRDAINSALRQAVCLGMGSLMFGLALTGIYEFSRGFAGAGILLAALSELGFGFAFTRIWLAGRAQN